MKNTRLAPVTGYLILLIYFLSGSTSLAYEVLWVRMLSLQFGVSIFGVVITVSAFMLGLGVGSLLGKKISKELANPLKLFAFIEISIAVLALMLPSIALIFDSEISTITDGSLFAWYIIEFIFIGLMLFIPALLMGIAFPVILEVCKKTNISLANIYGINALGASVGALLPLFLLPELGWLWSLRIIVFIGLMTGAAAFVLSVKSEIISQPLQSDVNSTPVDRYTLILYAIIGAAALMLEIGWTRLFGMVFLRTEYVIAIILAIFLVGVGLGSIISRYLHKQIWMTVMPILAGLFGVLSLWFVPYISSVGSIDTSNYIISPFIDTLFWQGMLIAIITLPVTLVLGAWLPLLSRYCGNNHSNNESVSTKLYGVNSIGAAVGTIVSGFVLTPLLGTSVTILLASLLLLTVGLAWAHSKKAWLVVPALAVFAVPVMSMPDVEVLLPDQYANTSDIYYREDALSITHVVERKNGQRLLLADLQRMDASSDPTAVQTQKNQARLPLLLHPGPKDVLFLGVGTGISASGSLPFPALNRTAVELSKGAITAAGTMFDKVNDRVLEQMTVIQDDARHFLMSNKQQYDVIIGDLFHPDLVGRSALLSVQQFQRAKDSLTNDGLFVQWLALNQFDQESLEIILRSFKKVYPDAVLFLDAFRLALVGSSNFQGAPAVINNLSRLSTEQIDMATGDEGQWSWLGRYWGKIQLADGRIQQEWSPVIEFKLPHARYNGDMDLSSLLSYLLNLRPHLKDAANELNIADSDFAAFERAYVATELAHRSWFTLLTNQSQEGQRLLRLAFQANPKDRWISSAVADSALASFDSNQQTVSEREALQAILRVRPDQEEALQRLWQLELKAGNDALALLYRDQLAAISPYNRNIAEKNY